MKKFVNTISNFLNSIARVRAASSLANMHRYEEAKNVMLKKS